MTLTFTTPSDREIVMTRVVRCAAPAGLRGLTNPEHLPHWMLGPDGWTMPVCEIDLRPGGAWHFVWRRSDGTEMEMRGVYREIVPPERLVSTESWGGDWPETLNTLILSEEDGKTTITQYVSTRRRRRATRRSRPACRKACPRASIVSPSTWRRSRGVRSKSICPLSHRSCGSTTRPKRR